LKRTAEQIDQTLQSLKERMEPKLYYTVADLVGELRGQIALYSQLNPCSLGVEIGDLRIQTRFNSQSPSMPDIDVLVAGKCVPVTRLALRIEPNEMITCSLELLPQCDMTFYDNLIASSRPEFLAPPQAELDAFRAMCRQVVERSTCRTATKHCSRTFCGEEITLHCDIELLFPDWPDPSSHREFQQVIEEVAATAEGRAYIDSINKNNSAYIELTFAEERLRYDMQQLLSTFRSLGSEIDLAAMEIPVSVPLYESEGGLLTVSAT